MKLTVFTPTYNRAYTLHKCYESLLRQTSNDFVWLVVDDGSTDNTRELVENWILDAKIKIRYIYQENQGVVKGHETALLNVDTELNICIDSDDYMPDNAVELILGFWDKHGSDDYAGIIGLDIYPSGQLIGDKFPEDLSVSTFADVFEKHRIKGDKKSVNRTDLAVKYLPYPHIQGERFPAVSYLYSLINTERKHLLLNEVFCVAEYLPDGISMNKNEHYKKSPRGFMVYRELRMKLASRYVDKYRHAVHYVSSGLIAKRKSIIRDSPYRITTLLAYPLGVLLYYYIMRSSKNTLNKALNK